MAHLLLSPTKHITMSPHLLGYHAKHSPNSCFLPIRCRHALAERSVATRVAEISREVAPWVEGDENSHMAWRSVRQEPWEGELVVEGNIPKWLNGTYLRNGPGVWHIGHHEFRHLFDGYATIIKVEFDDGGVVGGHRLLGSNAYVAAKKHKRLCFREFSETPARPKRALGMLREVASMLRGESLTDNANTGVVRLGDGRVVCLTETQKGSIMIDPRSLETVGKLEYKDCLTGMLIQSAHPMILDSDFWTVIPDLMKPGYVVAKMEAGSEERKVVGRVKCRGGPGPGWVHSFAATENFIVVPEMPLRYSMRNLLKSEPTALYKFEWHPESKAYMHVVCKKSGKTVASVEVPLFLTFHFINAYEEVDEEGRTKAIVADCCEHNADTTILDQLRLQNLRSLPHQHLLPDARVGRFRIDLKGVKHGTLESAIDPELHGRGMDMCSINPAFLGRRYRYAYACAAHRPCHFPNALTKIDLSKKNARIWHEHDSVPSEPFFVARPGATTEDDGVIISMVSHKNMGSYALLLDGTTFEEIARAKFPYGLPYGLHGCWIPRD